MEGGKDRDKFEPTDNYFRQGDHIKALEIIEDSILVHGKDKVFGMLNFLQGTIFKDLAKRAENTDVKFAFLLGSVECFSENQGFSSFCAESLFNLGAQLGSSLYYKESMAKGTEYLSVLDSFKELTLEDKNSQRDIKSLLLNAESRIAAAKNRVGSSMKKCEPEVKESKKNEETVSDTDLVKRLRSYWVGLNVEIKRNLLKVSTAELRNYVERLYGGEGRDSLEQVLDAARESNKWRFWMCRTCSQKFSTSEECKTHLEHEHAAELKRSSTKAMVQKIGKVWGRKISVEGWNPVDAVAAVGMIKDRLEDVKVFVYENGWSNDWPLAVDQDRSELLQEIRLLLVSFYDREILSCSIRDWVMRSVVKYLEKLEVSKQTLIDCHLVATPQSICFLECPELNEILDFLRTIKCERDDGTYLVCRAVDSFCDATRVKEKIDFDPQFSFLLLDKSLLQCKITQFDDGGRIDVIDPDVHYTKAHAQGDNIVSWLTGYSSGDEGFRFPRPIRTHNLDIWVAVLRAIQFRCRTLRTKYAKKLLFLDYDAALSDAKKLCINEDERRSNILEDQWNRYASLLHDGCKEYLTTDAADSQTAIVFLCAVRDVLGGALYPTFDLPDFDKFLGVIGELKHISDDIVLQSIDLLKSEVTKKVAIIDSKIVLIENSRSNLLKELTRLSVFDYRSYILRPLKEFLLEKIVDMESKARVAAAEAELLSEGKQEKEKKSGAKKKKPKSKKRASTSMSSNPPDQNVEHEPSVDLEKPEEDSMEPDDTLSSERGPLEISSNTENQEEVTKDMQTLEHLESAPGEAAARYNSALHMTVKALLNITVLKEDLRHSEQNLVEQVPCGLRNFFNAFVSEDIKTEGVYSFLLSDLLASLEEVHPVSSVAAEVVVDVLEYLHNWKSPKVERSLVTRLFTLEEYERMSCRSCRRKPNYPEQTSYGIAMAADSIRDLKCAFGNLKFVDILKLIRLEEKMLCDMKTGGCGKTNFVHHVISNCPPIFTIVLEWEKNETEKEISETTKALEWEIDMSRLYEGLEPDTKYRLVSMVGCGEEEEHICLAYKKNRWVSFRHEALAKSIVGNWKAVVRFCGEENVRPEILFYEAVQWANKGQR